MASAARVVLNPHRRGDQAMVLSRTLQEHVVGQSEAIESVVDCFQMWQAGLHTQQRPMASFLFLGPTGAGKTHLVEVLADSLFHDPQALIKVDCAEFQHSHEIARLIGSPPGYLGHRETQPVFTQEALDRHQTADLAMSIVLFDEIEKASDALWQLLLGILDKGTLTLGDNRRVSFAHSMIFLTSNLGAGEMQKMLQPGFGFAPHHASLTRPLQSKLDSVAVNAARHRFSPEFFNRLDRVVVFHPLDTEQLEKVLDLELELVRRRLSSRSGSQTGRLGLALTSRARQFLLEQGSDLKYGARHLKRAIERELVHPLANLIATGQVKTEDTITVDFEDETGLTFTRAAGTASVRHAMSAA